jgi:hypothetical protein
MNEHRMSNDELLMALANALRDEGALVARVIMMLIEVEDRRLHLQLACPSLFDFCTRRLGMSESEAFRRIAAARLANRFPQVLEAIRMQKVHLSHLVLVRNLVTPENVEDLLRAVSGKTKREVEELVAKLAPKPDARASIRKLRPQAARPVSVAVCSTSKDGSGQLHATELNGAPAAASPSMTAFQGECTFEEARASAPPTALPFGHSFGATFVSGPVTPSTSRGGSAPAPPSPQPQLTPTAEGRHKVQFTASSMLRDKLERAQSLMRHRNVSGDLAVVVERALDLLIAKLEKEKLGRTSRPNAPPPARAMASPDASVCDATSPSPPSSPPSPSLTVTTAARREVVRRDAEQCSFIAANGDRCPARDFLEIDHCHPRALGGSSDSANLRLLCRAHNQYAAERVFGREHISRAVDLRRRKERAPSTTAAPASAPCGSTESPPTMA